MKTNDPVPVLCTEKNMLETKMHDPASVLVTEKSLPESHKETLHGSFENILMLFIDFTSTIVEGQDVQNKE